MVGRLLVGFLWPNLQFSVSWLVDFQWVRVAQSLVFCVMVGRLLVGSCGSIFSFLCHGWQTFRGFVWLNLQFSVSWLVDFQWASCGSIFRFLCHGRQTFSGLRVSQSLVFCVMVGRLLVGSCGSNFSFLCHGCQTFSGFVWLNLQFSVSWLVDFQWGSCGSVFSFLCHGWQTFCGVRVAQSLVFCVMVGRLLVGFVWLNLQFSVSWLVDFQWGSCGSIFSFLCHGWQTFSGVRVAQSLVFCVIVGRLLLGSCGSIFMFSVSWLVDFWWGPCGSIFSFLCHGWKTFSGVRVAQSLVFCVMVGRLLVGFVWLNLQFSVSWLVDFQWASCGSIFRFLCHGWQTFSGVRVAQSFVFCVMVGRLLVGFVWLNLQFSVSWQVDFQWGSCGSIFSFLCYGWQTFSGVPVAQSFLLCAMVGRLLVGFVCLNLQFSVSWLVDFQWSSCGSVFSFLCHGWQTFRGFVWLNLQFSVSWLVDFQWASCGSIFRFLCHGRQTFSGVRVAQSLVFCVMVGRHLEGFVWLNLQVSVSLQVDFQRGSCGSIFSFLCHGWQTFSGVRVAQSLVFCVMFGRLFVVFVWLNLQLSVSWLVNSFQGGSCGSIFSFLCHGRQTFSGDHLAQSLVFCVMVGRLLVGFVCLNLQFSVLLYVDFQWGSCGPIFCFLCHGWQTFSGVRVAQSLVFCVMVGRLLVGFVWLNLQFSVSWQVDIQWVHVVQSLVFCVMVGRLFSGVRVAQSLVFCVMVGRRSGGFVWLNLQFSVSWFVDFQWASRGSIFRFLCHCRYTFSGVRVAESFVFCVMVGRLLVGFVWLNLQFSVSWLVDFQWGSCGSIFRFLCHGWQTFSGLRVAQSLDFCVMVGILLVGFLWLNLLFFVSWLVDFQWGSCDSILIFCVMVGRLLVGFVWLNLQFSVSLLVDFQWGSCGSIFSFLCHGWQTFSGVRVAQSLVFCVIVGRLLLGSCGSIFMFSVSWLVDFWWGPCGSIFSFLCHGWQTFSGVRVAQSLVFYVMVGRLLVGFVWLNLQFSVSWLVDFQWASCVSIFRFLCLGWQTFSGVRVAQSLLF